MLKLKHFSQRGNRYRYLTLNRIKTNCLNKQKLFSQEQYFRLRVRGFFQCERIFKAHPHFPLRGSYNREAAGGRSN